MSDLISRQAAKQAVSKMSEGETSVLRMRFRLLDYFDKMPSVQPEMKKGKWMDEGQYADFFPHHMFTCSECRNHLLEIDVYYDYCPFCGAKMEVIVR